MDGCVADPSSAAPLAQEPNISIVGLHDQSEFGTNNTNIDYDGIHLQAGQVAGASRLLANNDNQSGGQPGFGSIRIGSMSGGSQALSGNRWTSRP